ncbi:hypothetical protein LA080_003048 [Diaporthe eres]|nr:hypothetical protein LA080_003048 [Diaporthe eres]
MPLPPPIPPAASLPITYYDTNGSLYHASQYRKVHSPWNVNMNHYAPDPQQLQPGYYDTQFSVPTAQDNGYHRQHRKNHRPNATTKSLEEGNGIHDPKIGAYRAKTEHTAKHTTRSDPRRQSKAFLEPSHGAVKVNSHRKGFYNRPSGYLETFLHLPGTLVATTNMSQQSTGLEADHSFNQDSPAPVDL